MSTKKSSKKAQKEKQQKIIIIALIAIIAVIAIGLIIFIAGKGKDSNAEDASSTEPDPSITDGLTVDDSEVTKTDEDVYGGDSSTLSILTGLPIDESKANKRPMSCMIENTKAALPQYGLNQAGIVYECPAEGGITRLMAIYDNYDNMDRIGNVRSCRPYYAYISAEYDAIYVHYGQNLVAEELLKTGIVDDLNGLDGSVGTTVFYRTSDKKAPHNAYTSTDGINKGIEKKGYSTDLPSGYENHFKFYGPKEDNAIENGDPCEAVSLYFANNRPYFTYDSDKKVYKRFQFGAAETDALDGDQCTAKNIIIQYVPSKIYEGTAYLNITMNGTGKGVYITDGTKADITWSKASDSAITHYYYEDGTEITLNPGVTWVELCENSGEGKNTFYESSSDMKN